MACHALAAPVGQYRTLLQTICEQVVPDVDVETASVCLELEAEHWQQQSAAAAHRYAHLLELQEQIAEEAIGQSQNGQHPDKQHLCPVNEARALCLAVDVRHCVHSAGLTGDMCHVNLQSLDPHKIIRPMLKAAAPARLYHHPAHTVSQLHERSTALTEGQDIPDMIDVSQEP
jgi:hypothetical protein